MDTNEPSLYIKLLESETRWPLKRVQKYYWILYSGGNHAPLARSVEMFTNRQDCEHNARLVNGDLVTVYLRNSNSEIVDLLRTKRQDFDNSQF